MSEKRSWDIQPKAKVPVRPENFPQQVRPDRRIQMPVTRRVPKPTAARQREAPPKPTPPIIRRERVKQGRDREPLKERRRRERRRMLFILLTLLVIVTAAMFAALWSPAFRIQHVDAAGPDSDGIQMTALSSLTGTYKYVLPRNSIFFFPENDMRAQILQQYPDVSAISISRLSFNTIAIDAVPREAALLWCGATYTPALSSLANALVASTTATSTPSIVAPVQAPCYDADSQGDIFEPDTNPPADMIRMYDSLASSTNATNSPLGDTVAEASMLPNALELVKDIKSLGVPIVSLVLRGDEADMYAQSGTRITYVLGTEQATAELATSAFPSLNLNDGSLEYVDLRFAGKVYYKKVGSTKQTDATSGQ